MIGFALSTIATAIAFWIVTLILPDMLSYDGRLPGLLVLAVVFGLVNGVIGPIVRALALPLTIVTFGLFGFVVNAVLLLVVATISDAFGIAFTVGEFPPTILSGATIVAAIIGSIVLGIVSALVHLVVPD